jgi:YidC/Oxa1 family membrane protein insertase
MDKNTVIAFILIFIVILLMPLYFEAINENVMPPDSSQAIDTEEKLKPPIPTQERKSITQEGKVLETEEKTLVDYTPPEIYTIETDLYIAKLSSQGGGTINSFVLKNYEKRTAEDTSLVELINKDRKAPLFLHYISIDGDSIELNQNFKLDFTSHTRMDNSFHIEDGDSLILSFVLENHSNEIIAKKMLTFYGSKYTIKLHTDLTQLQNEMATDFYELSWYSGLPYTEPNITDEIRYSKAYAYSAREKEDIDVKIGKKEQTSFTGSTQWTAIRTKYFTAAFIPEKPALGYLLTGIGVPVQGKDYQKIFTMHISLPSYTSSNTNVFIGPLDYQIVKGLNVELENIMSFGGILRPISTGILWLFIQFREILPNYGWVLILFAILVKIVLRPLTAKSTRSMKEMQYIQPELAKIREKYKDNPQKMNAEQMKLFKEHGVNPMGGCLPLLLQMPILIALFTVFRSTIELRHAPFILWITDLSSPDTIYTLPFSIPIYGRHVNVLPFIMVASQVIQQKLTSTSTAPQQRMMMYLMPIMFFFIFNQFPSGLNLYYTMYNILTIIEQQYLPSKPKEPKTPKKKRPRSRLETLRQMQLQQPKKR